MIVQIKVRENDGRYKTPCAAEFAEAALREIYRAAPGSRGWEWLLGQLTAFCLRQALDVRGNPPYADIWIRRW